MANFVSAYNTRTGQKLDHNVPSHFVDELSHITGLARTPSTRPAAPAPVAAADPTPAAVVEGTNPEEGNL